MGRAGQPPNAPLSTPVWVQGAAFTSPRHLGKRRSIEGSEAASKALGAEAGHLLPQQLPSLLHVSHRAPWAGPAGAHVLHCWASSHKTPGAARASLGHSRAAGAETHRCPAPKRPASSSCSPHQLALITECVHCSPRVSCVQSQIPTRRMGGRGTGVESGQASAPLRASVSPSLKERKPEARQRPPTHPPPPPWP